MEKTFFERNDPWYVFEDEFVSVPSRQVDIEAEICKFFNIGLEEKRN